MIVQVSAFLLSGLAALDLGNVGAEAAPLQRPSGKGVSLSVTICRRKGHLHEDQLADQEEHHRKKSFGEELKLLVERYELRWKED